MTRLRIRELAWSPDGARPLLEGIELAVADGELVGLIGPNGSGKTSLLRCAYRFQRPSAGSVELDGEARRVRLLVFVVASLLTGVLVSLSGAIGFVGLMLLAGRRRAAPPAAGQRAAGGAVPGLGGCGRAHLAGAAGPAHRHRHRGHRRGVLRSVTAPALSG
jgi:energy-coupling factor transporter ATP-binding protein EcfA2